MRGTGVGFRLVAGGGISPIIPYAARPGDARAGAAGSNPRPGGGDTRACRLPFRTRADAWWLSPAVLLLAGPTAQPAGAAGSAYDHLGAGFVHGLRAAALESEAHSPNRVVVATGYSAVHLDKYAAREHGQCEAAGAVAHLDLRQGLFENSGPPDAYTKVPHM